jgi:hypothetical protein
MLEQILRTSLLRSMVHFKGDMIDCITFQGWSTLVSKRRVLAFFATLQNFELHFPSYLHHRLFTYLYLYLHLIFESTVSTGSRQHEQEQPPSHIRLAV